MPAFPENLIEAELFGYEKGSFTGAAKDGKIGLVEAADGGTLFLDEINSLPINVQGKLLRTLEEKSIQRIGSTKTKKVNFRLIAATNRNLQKLVEQGQFRETCITGSRSFLLRFHHSTTVKKILFPCAFIFFTILEKSIIFKRNFPILFWTQYSAIHGRETSGNYAILWSVWSS